MNYQYTSQVIYNYILINANYSLSNIQGVHRNLYNFIFLQNFKC